MKKVLIGIIVLLLTLTMILSFSACRKASGDADYTIEADGVISSPSMKNSSGTNGVQKIILTNDRMMVYTVNLDLSVEDYSTAATAIRAALDEAGGYEQQSYTSNSGYYRFTLRVPTANLNAFLEKVGETGSVEEQTVTGKDITDDYLNAEAERDALLAKKAAFEALATQATTFDEQLKIQEKIIEVAAEIDRYNDRLSDYKKSSDYSTVEINLYEEGTYEEPGFWQKLGDIFLGSGKSIGYVFGVILIIIVAVFPYLALCAGGFGIYALIRLIICRAKKRPYTLFPRRKKAAQAAADAPVAVEASTLEAPAVEEDKVE